MREMKRSHVASLSVSLHVTHGCLSLFNVLLKPEKEIENRENSPVRIKDSK